MIKQINIIIILLILLNIYIYLRNNNESINPKITVFLPIYNKEYFLERTIGSIQNQTLKDIEIIAVNDFSNDKSLEILKKLQLRDKRIKIINNNQNLGLLYSNAMGIIHSKGRYLFKFDPDDEFSNEENLEYLYNKAISSDIDIIAFNYSIKSMNNSINLCNHFDSMIYQPNLFMSIYDNNKLKDYLIWNKLIKREVFLKAYELPLKNI